VPTGPGLALRPLGVAPSALLHCCSPQGYPDSTASKTVTTTGSTPRHQLGARAPDRGLRAPAGKSAAWAARAPWSGLFHRAGFTTWAICAAATTGTRATARSSPSRTCRSAARFLQSPCRLWVSAPVWPGGLGIIHSQHGYVQGTVLAHRGDGFPMHTDKRSPPLSRTADLIRPSADSCYLEKIPVTGCKCRVSCSAVSPALQPRHPLVKYAASGLDLLRQDAPEFVAEVRNQVAAGGDFHPFIAYSLTPLPGNPLCAAQSLQEAIERKSVPASRAAARELAAARPAAIFAPATIPMATMRGLMLGHIKRVWAATE